MVSAESFAQPAAVDTLQEKRPLLNAISYYHSSAGAKSLLYNGIKRKGYTADIQGSAYFMSDDWQNGGVYFDNILFDDVPVLYDQVKDELLTLTPDKITIRLVSERIDRFLLAGHTFVRIDPDGNSMTGFYDLLRAGETAVLVKRKKIIHENTSQGRLLRRFLSENGYYLRKGKHYFAIRSMRNVLAVLNDKKNEIRQLVKDRKLDMKADPGDTLLEIASYYDDLNTSL